MANEDPRPDENEESTLNGERESEDAEDLENLFSDSVEPEEDAPVSRKEYENLKKGAQKLATELGRIKSKAKDEAQEPKKEDAKTDTSDLDELFFEQTPVAELVNEDLKQIASAKGISIVKAWRSEKWLQEKASALDKAKKEEEEAKSKIENPSGQIKKGKENYENLKDEEIANLSVAEYEKYREWRLNKEKAH